MYACMYVSMYVCMYVFMYIDIIYIYVCVYMYASVHVYVNVMFENAFIHGTPKPPHPRPLHHERPRRRLPQLSLRLLP